MQFPYKAKAGFADNLCSLTQQENCKVNNQDRKFNKRYEATFLQKTENVTLQAACRVKRVIVIQLTIDIQFTKEIVTHDNNELRTTTYRKPTHTDRLLDQSSYNPTSHKATTIRTLTRRA